MKPVRPKKIETATTTAVSAIWIVLGMASLATIGTIVATITGRYIWIFGDGDTRIPLDHMPQILQADPFEGQEAWLIDAQLWVRLVGSVGNLIALAILVLTGVFLHRVITGIALSKPFSLDVLKSWKTLSMILILGGAAQGIANTLTFAVLYKIAFSNPDTSALGTSLQVLSLDLPQWPWWTILLGIVAQALYGAFKTGAQLEQDVTGLV